MIRRKTVFVLGAGAHCPYGFPDGMSLTKEIVSRLPLNSRDIQNDLYDELLGVFPQSKGPLHLTLPEFRKRLDKGGHSSIDSFLVTHAKEQGYPEIGKYAVASILLPREFRLQVNRSSPVNERDWLSMLFAHMHQGCLRTIEEFVDGNNVSFITFNYDRTLEYFFCTKLEHTYGITREAAWDAFRRFPLIHVYGSLGEFHPGLSYDIKRRRIPQEVLKSASSLRLMYEDRGDQSEVELAKKELSTAACVCFLGFAFDHDNIARLELNNRCHKKAVYATRYEVADGDWGRVVERMQPAMFTEAGKREWHALTFLHESRALG